MPSCVEPRPPARPQEREEVVKKSTAVLVPYVKKIEAATDAGARRPSALVPGQTRCTRAVQSHGPARSTIAHKRPRGPHGGCSPRRPLCRVGRSSP